MKYFLTIAFTALLFTSCRKDDTGYHLPPKVMQKLLLDINIAEAYSLVVKDSVHRPPGKNPDSLAVYYKDIFAHYHITPEQFSENMDWYKNHPEEIDTIYAAIGTVIASWQSRPFKMTPVYPKAVFPYYEKPQIQSWPVSPSPDLFDFFNAKDTSKKGI